jgi:signal transduction histidine kinase
MNIRSRLTIQFLTIAAIIMLLSSIAIYLLSANYRRVDFYERLQNKANNTAKLLIEVDEVDATLLRKIEKDNPVSLPDERIIIFDFKNKTLFSTDENHKIKTDIKLLNTIRLDGEIRYKQDKYEVLGFLFTAKYDRFVVITAATDIYGKKRIRSLTTILFIVVTISLLLFLISGWFYAGRALKPVTRIIEDVNDITVSSLNLRLHEGSGKDELEQLARTFNNMLEHLEAAFKTQKDFIANASHELRTPLTSITGQLEFILMKPRTLEEYQNTLTSVFEDIRNLNALSNRLLLLAHASSDIPESAFLPVRLDEITWQASEELQKYNPGYAVKINLDDSLDDETMTVSGDEQLLKTAIHNLIENSCKYSNDHTVTINIKSALPNILIEFIDHGIGISPDDLLQITKPFFRGINVKSIKGSGIGLSLVDRVVKMHHGTMQIISKINNGTQIYLQFPLQSDKDKS